MDQLDRFQIAAQLREIAAWLRFRRGEHFRVQAYERGAMTVEAAAGFEALAANGRLTDLPGVGRAIAGQIEELRRTGRSRYLESLRGELPAQLASLPEAARISAAKVLLLHRALGVRSAEDLLAAARAGRVRTVRGFGARTEERIIEALTRAPAAPHARIPVDRARLLAEEAIGFLRRTGVVRRADLAGELRRAEETIGVVSIVLESEAPDAVFTAMARFPRIVGTTTRYADRMSATLQDGGRLLVRVAAPAGYGTTLFEETGPPEHVAEVLARAGDPTPAADEAELYARAGLTLIVPEQREHPGIIEDVLDGEDLDDLVCADDLRGAVHCHTTASDGKHSVEEMARAAEALGFEYLTITDHSPSASYAGGLDLDRLRRQWDEIDEVQERVGIRILRGTESDITREGALDYPDEVLARLDVIIASIHARHRMSAAEMTERVVRAMRHPLFKIWGHPLGRILLHREPYECDVDRILDTIAGANAAIELNGDPRRLDLPPALVPAARARGIRFVVSADAHSVQSLQNARRYGVGIARRGGVRRDEVLNALPVEAFVRLVRPLGEPWRRVAEEAHP